MDQIKVVIVDDHPIVREGVRMVLANDGRIDIVGECGNVESTLAVLAAEKPDLVLLDLNLEGGSSLDHMESIVAASPGTRILILTGEVSEEANTRAAAGGACGLVMKSQAASSLLMAVKKVHRGEVWFDRAFTAKLLNDAKKRNLALDDAEASMQTLTRREREIITLIAQGLVNKDIAKQLLITEKTVRNSLTVIYSKLSCSNRLELALFAARHGLSS
jgi:DNA-binding NarL/FixJ family response regulator